MFPTRASLPASVTSAVAHPGPGDRTGAAWHHGDPLGEQRAATRGAGLVDRAHRRVMTITGSDRLTWLHSLCSQHLTELPDGAGAEALFLDPQGRVEHHVVLSDLAGVTYLDTPGARAADLLDHLRQMVFRADVTPAPADLVVLTLLGPASDAVLAAAGSPTPPAAAFATVSLGPGDVDASAGLVRRMPGALPTVDLLVPAATAEDTWCSLVSAGATPLGDWGHAALRAASLRPEIGIDTDARTIPQEAHWVAGPVTPGVANPLAPVHLDKGCYRGQETVARVHNLGRPPRRLVVLHLDGSADDLPEPGTEVTAGGRVVGRLGTVTVHHDDGPIALALVKRSVGPEVDLLAGRIPARIDPDTLPAEDGIGAGRAAVDRLRGRRS